MRDYVLVAFLVASFPVALVRPFYGLLVYTWISFMYPHMLAWSFAQTFPAAKLAVFSFVAGTIMNRTGDSAPLRTRETVTLIGLWCTFGISSIFAFYPSDA